MAGTESEILRVDSQEIIGGEKSEIWTSGSDKNGFLSTELVGNIYSNSVQDSQFA